MSGESAADFKRPKRVSAWKVIGLVFGSLVLLLVVLLIWVSIVGNRRFAAMESKLKKMVAETEARDPSRPVLRGTAVPGNAWDDYSLALKEIDAIKTDRYAFGDYLYRGPKADRSKVEGHLAAHGVALDHLQRGASRAYGRLAYHWEKNEVPGLLTSQYLANMSACRSRFLVEEGKHRKAAEMLLDTCQFARDLGYNGGLICEMIAIAMYSVALDELRDLIRINAISPDDLLEVERELEILDRSFPPTRLSILNEPLGIGYMFIRAGTLSKVNEATELKRKLSGNGTIPDLRFGGLVGLIDRFGGLRRLILADAFDTSHEFLRRCADLDEKAWADVQRIGVEMAADTERLRNPVTVNCIPEVPQCYSYGRERRAQLRLLRVAVHYRATGEILELDDTFGTKLRTSKSGDRLKVWSVGKDGVDDGGVGEWKPNAGKDIVLEVDR